MLQAPYRHFKEYRYEAIAFLGCVVYILVLERFILLLSNQASVFEPCEPLGKYVGRYALANSKITKTRFLKKQDVAQNKQRPFIAEQIKSERDWTRGAAFCGTS